MKKTINPTKKSTLFLTILSFTLILFSYFLYSNNRTQSAIKAKETTSFNTDSLSSLSNVSSDGPVTRFSLYKEKGYLYKSNNTGPAASWEVLKAISQSQFDNQSKDVKRSSYNPLANFSAALPTNLINNSTLIRYHRSSKDKYLIDQNINLNSEHFFYEQKINDMPVIGSTLSIHMKNNNEIYAIDGNWLKNTTINPQIIPDNQAIIIAMTKAAEETAGEFPLLVYETKKYVYNRKAIDSLSDDSTNRIVLAVTIAQNTIPSFFAKRYLVNLTTGEIIYSPSEDLIKSALNRIVRDTKDQRKEGDLPINNKEIDDAYDILGKVYHFFYDNFGRDSFDNLGSPLSAGVGFTLRNINDQRNKTPGAYWMNDNTMVIWKGFAVEDLIAHEFTHGVNNYSAQLGSSNQSAALIEGIGNIFGFGVDNNWTTGENSIGGILARMDNPMYRAGYIELKPAPDRLFSPNYFCPAKNDCGLYVNNGIIEKAFYLMTEGGNFNGCIISGIGKEKSLAIIYRALTIYFSKTTNYYQAYRGIMQACNDLFPQEANTCLNVRNAMMATEMDQQPEGEENSPLCSGHTGPFYSPKCNEPYSTVFPVNPRVSPTPTIKPTSTLAPIRRPNSLPIPTKEIPSPTKSQQPAVKPSSTTAPYPTPTKNPSSTPSTTTPSTQSGKDCFRTDSEGVEWYYPSGFCNPSPVYEYCNNGSWITDPNHIICPLGKYACTGNYYSKNASYRYQRCQSYEGDICPCCSEKDIFGVCMP